jgi:hypothetical protein
MASPNIDDDNFSEMIAFFADRLSRVFSHFFCSIEFHGDADFLAPPTLSNSRQLGLRTIRSACFHETLLAFRDIEDVLTNRGTKRDDLRISDFGYTGQLPFLTSDDRNKINKAIAHTTTYGADLSLKWDTSEILAKCISQSLTFLKWIEYNKDMATGIYCRIGIERTYAFIVKQLRKNALLDTI